MLNYQRVKPVVSPSVGTKEVTVTLVTVTVRGPAKPQVNPSSLQPRRSVGDIWSIAVLIICEKSPDFMVFIWLVVYTPGKYES